MSEVMEKPETAKRVVILNPQRIGLAEQKRQDWIVDAEEGTTIEDVLNPAYWAHCAAQMSVFDNIFVRLETGEWMVHLIVLQTGRNYLRAHLAHQYDFTNADTSTPANAITHVVEWKGPVKKHVVIRKADGAVIQDGFSGKNEAQQWLTNYLNATNA